MEISFVIVTYKRGPFLKLCLDSIYAQKNLPKPCEIIIVDNYGDVELPPPSDPGIHLQIEKSEDNLWATGGRNRGIQLAQGKFVVMIDDDAVLHDEHDITRALAHLKADSRCGVVTGRSLNPAGEIIIQELPHPNKAFLLDITGPVQTPYFYAMLAVIRRDLLVEIGGYPERFRYGSEEFDLSYQVIGRGYHILYDPQIAVYHHKTSAGRELVGGDVWRQVGMNKVQVAYRLLPYPYPATTFIGWSVGILVKTRNPTMVWSMWSNLWKLRRTLNQERRPLHQERVRYIQQIGGRLLY